MKINRWLIVYFLITTTTISCKKEQLINEDPKSFNEIYETFWREMNINYVYWDIDKTNWDNLYSTYKPLFNKLDINNENDIKSSVSYFKSITDKLIDSHYSISFQKQILKDSAIYPAYTKNIILKKIHNKYDFSNLVPQYLDTGYISSAYFYSENNIPKLLFTRLGTINKRILYFACNQFALSRTIQSKDPKTTSLLNKLDFYLNESTDIKGLIFDFRGNNGGNIVDLNYLIGKIIDRPVHFGYVRYKNGNNRLDYTPWINTTVAPQSTSKKFQYPIIALVDNYSASLSETFAMVIHTLPNGIIVGERTWGATGPIANNNIYNYGSFIIRGFMNVTMASGEFKYLDNKSYEEIGFPPDISAAFSLTSYQSGIDSQLQKAIDQIEK